MGLDTQNAGAPSAGKSAEIFANVATTLHGHGFTVMPVRGKDAFMRGHGTFWLAQQSEDTVRGWMAKYGNLNTGLCLGEVVAIDIDIDDQQLAEEVHELVTASLGVSQFLRFGRRPRRALLYRIDRAWAEHVFSGGDVGRAETGKVQFLGRGTQLVIYGTHPITQQPYEWPLMSPLHASINAVPWTTVDKLDELREVLEKRLSSSAGTVEASADAPPTAEHWSVDYLPHEGERDKFLFWYAREMAAIHENYHALEEIVLQKNAKFPKALPQAQAKSKAKSAWNLKSEGRLMRSGKNAPAVLPVLREKLAECAHGLTPAAAKLYLVLVATRDSREPFTIPQQATANHLRVGKPTLVNAIEVLIANDLIEDTGLERRHAQRYRLARQYRFIRASPSIKGGGCLSIMGL
jgi:hypothetical protein